MVYCGYIQIKIPSLFTINLFRFVFGSVWIIELIIAFDQNLWVRIGAAEVPRKDPYQTHNHMVTISERLLWKTKYGTIEYNWMITCDYRVILLAHVLFHILLLTQKKHVNMSSLRSLSHWGWTAAKIALPSGLARIGSAGCWKKQGSGPPRMVLLLPRNSPPCPKALAPKRTWPWPNWSEICFDHMFSNLASLDVLAIHH